MNYILAYSRGWDETQPPDSQPANLLGQDLRQLKQDVRERMISFASGPAADMPAPEAVWGSANDGVIYFQTDTNNLYRWNGAQWILLRTLDLFFTVNLNISLSAALVNYWRAPFACTLKAIRFIVVGGAGGAFGNSARLPVGGGNNDNFAADVNIATPGAFYSNAAPIAGQAAFAVGDVWQPYIRSSTLSGAYTINVQGEFVR
jgi:hypothetical protein